MKKAKPLKPEDIKQGQTVYMPNWTGDRDGPMATVDRIFVAGSKAPEPKEGYVIGRIDRGDLRELMAKYPDIKVYRSRRVALSKAKMLFC